MNDDKKIRLSPDGCVDERDMLKIPKSKSMMVKVKGIYQTFDCKMVLIPVETRKGYEQEPMLVDVVTGTIYDPKTGQCNSSKNLQAQINQGQS